MCIHVCTSMYVGRSLTEPRQPSRMSTIRSGIEDAGIESTDSAEPEKPIGMASADCFHTMSFVLFVVLFIHMYVHMYVRTYVHTNIRLIPTHGG